MNMKTAAAIAFICSLSITGVAAETNRYPNEVVGYRFYQSAPWRGLVPLKSTMADVRKVLGKPSREEDIADYMAPYPGDEKAVQPVWTYDVNDDWRILVYFVKSGVPERRVFDESLYDYLFSIDYVSRRPVHFDLAKLPAVFRRSHTVAADAAWDEYTDGSGLIYEIYTSKTQFGGHVPGDLNRIKYGPPSAMIPNQEKKKAQSPAGDSLKAVPEE
jgi:hypothetical protein